MEELYPDLLCEKQKSKWDHSISPVSSPGSSVLHLPYREALSKAQSLVPHKLSLYSLFPGSVTEADDIEIRANCVGLKYLPLYQFQKLK